MKKTVARKAVMGIFMAVVIVSSAAYARVDEHSCSLAHSAGKWSFTDNGTVIGIGSRTAVGVVTFDGNGNLVNGVATSSLNGTVAQETFSGTYTVNSDCTGTASAKIYSGGSEILAVTFSLSFDDDMRHMRAVFTSLVLPDGTPLASVINLDARKQ